MDYNPLNIAVKGESQGAYFEPTIGPYDYWAIEYAYKPLPKETETEELAKIAARGATDPLLAFSSDEETVAGLDPDASQFDLGSDPLALPAEAAHDLAGALAATAGEAAEARRVLRRPAPQLRRRLPAGRPRRRAHRQVRRRRLLRPRLRRHRATCR